MSTSLRFDSTASTPQMVAMAPVAERQLTAQQSPTRDSQQSAPKAAIHSVKVEWPLYVQSLARGRTEVRIPPVEYRKYSTFQYQDKKT